MQGYAWEITTAEGGWGLDKVLQSRQHLLNGITNGIDLDEWDPEADEHTAAAYSASDLSGKAACKEALQKELGLEVNPDVGAQPSKGCCGQHHALHGFPRLPKRVFSCDYNNCNSAPNLESSEAEVLHQRLHIQAALCPGSGTLMQKSHFCE